MSEIRITIAELVVIGDGIVDSIGRLRLENDAVLRDKVEAYRKARALALAPPEGKKERGSLERLSGTIRDIEKRLDLVSPD